MAQFNSPGAVISTAQYDLHRMRRKQENSFFSKRNIVALEPIVYTHIDRLCKRLEEFKENKSPLTVNHAMLCFTGDVVSEYVFGESWHLLDTADFAPWMLSANKKIGEYSHALKQWPWFVHILNSLPLPWIARVAPDVAKILEYEDVGNSFASFDQASDTVLDCSRECYSNS
jgi:cytochrome P450